VNILHANNAAQLLRFDVCRFPRKIQSHNRITVAIGCFPPGNSPKMNDVSKEPEIAKQIVSMNSEVKEKTFRGPNACENSD